MQRISSLKSWHICCKFDKDCDKKLHLHEKLTVSVDSMKKKKHIKWIIIFSPIVLSGAIFLLSLAIIDINCYYIKTQIKQIILTKQKFILKQNTTIII